MRSHKFSPHGCFYFIRKLFPLQPVILRMTDIKQEAEGEAHEARKDLSDAEQKAADAAKLEADASQKRADESKKEAGAE